MSNLYRRLWAVPGAIAFETAGVVGRMAHLMTVLSIVFFVSAIDGSYRLAGVAGAAYAMPRSARWSGLGGAISCADSPLLNTALSFESVLDESILVTAPIVVSILAGTVPRGRRLLRVITKGR